MSSHFKPIANQHIIVPMLGKMRGALAIGSPLFLAGKPESCLKVYMRVVNDLMSERNRSYFNAFKLKALEETMEYTSGCKDMDENARLIRSELESIYDGLIDEYCGLNGVSFDPIHKKISKTITICQPLVKAQNFKECARIYMRVAQDILSNAKSLSDKAFKMLNSVVCFNEESKDYEHAVLDLRKSLDYVYDEIRLPDLYREATNAAGYAQDCQGEHVLLVGATDTEKQVAYEFVMASDELMGGNSQAKFAAWSRDDRYGIFEGTLGNKNKEQFIALHSFPNDPLAFREDLEGSKGILIIIKNMGPKTERIKLLLGTDKGAKAFNWQCDFILPVKEVSTQIYLPFAYFWPSLFGHVLSNNGNVDIGMVSSVGVLLSSLTTNGKPSPEFAAGHFCLGIEAIFVVKC